jgi:flagellar assembly protein FliH
MQMRAAPAKFLFENDFAKGGGKPSITLEEHGKRLREAEAAALARGIEQGRGEARADAEQRCSVAVERIAAGIAVLDRQLRAIELRLETEAVEVAVEIARKLAPELVRREPFAEIAVLAAGCFRNLVKCPHVVVRVNDALLEPARARIDEIARRCGLDATLVLLAEPDIAPGDCSIEWADGGIRRDSTAIAAAIETAVGRYIAARRASGEGSEPVLPGIFGEASR